MTKLLAFLARRQGMSHEDFVDHYEHVHVPMIRGLAPGIVSYRRNYLDKPSLRCGPRAIEPDFDVVTEFGFNDEGSFRLAMAALAQEAPRIQADESQFLDVDRLALFRVDTRS